MTHPRKDALLFAVPLLLHGFLSAQQTFDSAASTPAHVATAPLRFAALQVEDGMLVGAGADYRARFDETGVQFVPALGESAPIEYPVALRAIRHGRGVTNTPLAPVRPSHRVHTVSYHHGPMVETYDVDAAGLKQSFVFYERPTGTGDLVVELQVTTDLALAGHDDTSVELRNEYGGVRIAGVVGIDADGRRCVGNLAWHDGALTLRLPATFVDVATLPLVLDPWIGALITVNSTGNNLDPDVAYDADLDRYMVVWWRRISSITGDIYGQFVHGVNTGSGDLSGTSVIVRTGSNAQRARVGNCSVRNAFVIGWQEVVTMVPLPTHRDIYVRAMSPTLSGSAFGIFPGPPDEYGIEIAGDSTESNASVMIGHMLAGNGRLMRIRVSASLACTIGTATSVTSGGTTAFMRICKNGGVGDRYLVCTTSNTGTATLRVYTGTGTPTLLGAAVTLPSSTTIVDLASDGDGTTWALGWMRRESASSSIHDIAAAVYAWNPTAGALQQVVTAQTFSTSGVDEVRPSVALIDRTFALAHVRPGTTSELRVRTFGMQSCLTCEAETTVLSSTSSLSSAMASQASSREAGASREELLLVTQAATSQSSQVHATRFQADAGIATTVAAGCGGLTAIAADECARNGAVAHYALLLGAPAGSTGWLVMSPDRRDAIGCGPCVLVPDLWNAFIVGPASPDAFGTMTVGLPIQSSSFLIGYRFYEQWLVLDAVSPGCAAFPFDFSNALQIEIQ